MMDLKPLFTDLVRLEIELWDSVDGRLRRETGLQLRDFLLIQVIGSTASCRVYSLVEQVGITVGTASKAVDRLERAGHCTRRNNPQDRRSPIIELTEEGERLLATATLSVDSELEARLASALSTESLDVLADTIAKVRANRNENGGE